MHLVTKRAGLENAVAIGDWLVERSHEDPIVVFEVKTRLDETLKAIEDLSQHLSSHKNEAQRLLLAELEFTEMVEDMESRLDRAELQLSMLDPISAKYTVARQQHEQFKPLFREIQQLRHVHDAIVVSLGADSGDGGIDDPAKELLKAKANEKVSDVTRRWQNTWSIAGSYHLQITSVLPFEEIHHYGTKRFQSKLEEAENELEMLKSSRRSTDVPEHLATEIEVSIPVTLYSVNFDLFYLKHFLQLSSSVTQKNVGFH